MTNFTDPNAKPTPFPTVDRLQLAVAGVAIGNMAGDLLMEQVVDYDPNLFLAVLVANVEVVLRLDRRPESNGGVVPKLNAELRDHLIERLRGIASELEAIAPVGEAVHV